MDSGTTGPAPAAGAGEVGWRVGLLRSTSLLSSGSGVEVTIGALLGTPEYYRVLTVNLVTYVVRCTYSCR